jgi:hypothetical protein
MRYCIPVISAFLAFTSAFGSFSTSIGTSSGTVSFEYNAGHLDGDVKYFARSPMGNLFITLSGEMVYSFTIREASDIPLLQKPVTPLIREDSGQMTLVLKEKLIGGSVRLVEGEKRSGIRLSHFNGNDPSKWKSDIPCYESITFGEVYPEISFRLRMREKNIEKLFVVNPHGDPGDISIELSGALGLELSGTGELVVKTELGTVRFTKPVAYQEIDGKREYVDAAYAVKGNRYGFSPGEYDRDRTLVIDPLISSTCLGGSGEDGNFEVPMIMDGEGNIYVTSRTNSTDFPTITGAYSDTSSGGNDIFVSKFDNDLTTLLASTYIGGSGDEGLWPGVSMALGANGDVYISARTNSSDFPVTPGAYNENPNGGEDVIVARLSNDLSELLASTYLGGSARDRCHAMTADERGNVYVTGNTTSHDFPFTPGVYDSTKSSGGYFGTDIFVSIFDSTLSSLTASSFLGGSSDDYTEEIALDSDANIFLTGWISSTDFPWTPGAYDTTYNGYYYDAFVSKFSPDLTQLSASTYLGGSSWDFGYAMALDDNDNVYVSGHIASSNFPWTPGAYDTTYSGVGGPGSGDDSFVTKFGNDLDTLLASTFLGHRDWEIGTYITFDGDGFVYVGGYTTSQDFPTTPGAYNEAHNGGESDVCISKLDPGLTTLVASTFFGGSAEERQGYMLIDDSGNVVFSGTTNSTDMPFTSGVYDTTYNGGGSGWGGENLGGDIYISRLDSDLSANPTIIDEPAVKLPRATLLYENYPNPFNPHTTIKFHLQQAGPVTLKIYNIKGQLVNVLVDDTEGEGYHEVSWDGKDKKANTVSSGIYFYKLTVDGETTTRKMVLLQ